MKPWSVRVRDASVRGIYALSVMIAALGVLAVAVTSWAFFGGWRENVADVEPPPEDTDVFFRVAICVITFTLVVPLFMAFLRPDQDLSPQRMALYRNVTGFAGSMGVIGVFTVTFTLKDDLQVAAILLFAGPLVMGLAYLVTFPAHVLSVLAEEHTERAQGPPAAPAPNPPALPFGPGAEAGTPI